MTTFTVTFSLSPAPTHTYQHDDAWHDWVADTLARVADATGIPLAAMRARGNRGRKVARARAIAALLLREEAGLTLAEIATALGRATPASAAAWLAAARAHLTLQREPAAPACPTTLAEVA